MRSTENATSHTLIVNNIISILIASTDANIYTSVPQTERSLKPDDVIIFSNLRSDLTSRYNNIDYNHFTIALGLGTAKSKRFQIGGSGGGGGVVPEW